MKSILEIAERSHTAEDILQATQCSPERQSAECQQLAVDQEQKSGQPSEPRLWQQWPPPDMFNSFQSYVYNATIVS